MTLSERLRELEARFRAYPVTEAPDPWRRTLHTNMGNEGLEAVGFAPGTELLLTVSGDGRNVFDGATGEAVAYDYDNTDPPQWSDEFRLTAEGIGPLAGQAIRVGGQWGGGPPVGTSDGWNVYVITLSLFERVVLLGPPGAWPWDDKTFGQCCKVFCTSDAIDACGFSETGSSLVITANGWPLILFHRETALADVE